jgi:molybdopterin/thiamine biosynthesis adenylyltransferase
MAQIVRDINPTAEVTVFTEPIGPANADAFLDGADALVDGIDAFEIGIRRLLFGRAARKGIHAVSAGPFGFSTGWVVFDPDGMSFDRYFDIHDAMDEIDQFVAFIVGMAPRAIHRDYIDLSYVDFQERRGPSAGLACHLSSGVVAAELVKVLLRQGPLRPAPWFHQFDAYLGKYVCGRLRFGGRGPLQRLKRYVFARRLRAALRGT